MADDTRQQDPMQTFLDALIASTDEKIAQVVIYTAFFKAPMAGAIRHPRVKGVDISAPGLYEFLAQAVEGEPPQLLQLRSGHITIVELLQEQPRIVTPGMTDPFGGTPH